MAKKITKNFIWHGINASGFKTKGKILAQNKIEAETILANQKITVLKISKQIEIRFFSAKNKITESDITDLSIEFSTLISAGISLTAALHIMVDSAKKSVMKNMLVNIKKQVENGSLLSEAIREQSLYFDQFFCNLVYTGEHSGTLDIILKHIAAHREKVAVLKKKIKKALFYPVIVLIVALGVTCAMLIFIMPQFARLFESVGAELPMLTKMIIRCSDYIRGKGSILFLLPVIGWIFLKMGTHYFKSWQYFFDRFWLRWPLLGNILLESIFARCFHTLAMTLQSGLSLLDALHLTENTAVNSIYAQGFNTIGSQIKNGQTLSVSMKNTSLFPERIIRMVYIGEESGHLEKMLQKLAEYFAEQVDYKVQNLTQLLEPVLMVFLSLVVGTFVIAMYLPIFRLGSVL